MADQIPKLVRAKYAYKAANNDELEFSKGDIVTLTQVMDGGWWEGTLNGKTGWFPSNYVMEHKADDRAAATKGQSATAAAAGSGAGGKSVESKREHHAIVTRSFVDTETAYVGELNTFVQTVLKPLSSASILSVSEYATLCGNVEELLTFHQAFLTLLGDCAKLPVIQQRVGGLFMKHAHKFKSAYYAYAANHPRAVTVLSKYKDELNRFMEAHGASPPGSMALTTSLSVPFQRLDKYPSLLKELERHIDDAHIDRGDTQRAIAIYRDIQMSCTEIRKDKEMETEILNSPIKNWEGEDIYSLGDVQLAANVQVCQSEASGSSASAPGIKDRICLLFPSSIVLLSVTASLGYQYEGKLLSTGVTVKKLEDSERWTNAVEISGSMIETIVLSFASPQKQLRWYDRLMQLNRKSPVPNKIPGSAAAASGAAVATPMVAASGSTIAGQIATAGLTAVTQVTLAAASVPKVSAVPGNLKVNAAASATLPLQQQQLLQHRVLQQHSAPTLQQHSQPVTRQLRTWSRGFCMRPLPPARPMLASRDDSGGSGRTSPRLGRKTSTLGRRKTTIDDTKTLQKDSHILRVIEAYCTSTKTRHTVNSSVMDTPNMLIAEEEKIICEETKGDQTIVEEKSLVDTVYAIKDKLKEVQLEQSALRKELDEERRYRKKLEAYVMNNFKSSSGPHPTLLTCRQSSIEAVVASDGGAKS